MKPNKLLIAINSAPENSFRRMIIQASCINLKIPEIEYHFFVGRPNAKTEKVGNIVYLNCDGTYEALSIKMLAYLNFIKSREDYDYLFKTDDNTFFNPQRLLGLSRKIKGGYAGSLNSGPFLTTYHYGKVKNDIFNKPYSEPWRGPYAHGGPGYFISRAAVKALLESTKKLDPKLEFYEDKFIGDSLTDLGFKLEDISSELRFHSREALIDENSTIKCRKLRIFFVVAVLKKVPNPARKKLLSFLWWIRDLKKSNVRD